MICESCGDNSGKYNLCKKCYYLFKDGKLIKCENVANGIVQIQVAKAPQFKVMTHNNLKNSFIILNHHSLLKLKKDFIM